MPTHAARISAEQLTALRAYQVRYGVHLSLRACGARPENRSYAAAPDASPDPRAADGASRCRQRRRTPPRAARPASHAPGSKGGIAYRWVDEQGVRALRRQHTAAVRAAGSRACSTARAWRSDISRPQKTPEQAAADAQTQSRRTASSASTTASCVTTYTSVKDIEALRDVRLDQLQGQRTAAEQYVESLRARLGDAAGARAVLPALQRARTPGACRMTWPRTWCAR